MNRLQRQLSVVISGFCFLLAVTNFINYSFLSEPGLPGSILVPSVWVMPILGFVVFFFTSRDYTWSRVLQAMLFLGVSGPVLYLNGPDSFIGFWMLLLGCLLLYRYGLLERNLPWKVIGVTIWTILWIFFSSEKRTEGRVLLTLNLFLFLATAMASLYYLFEEEIRDLLAANKQKDVEIAEREAEIARLEPLSTLGERVAHVAHSFKNNLSLLGTAQFHLEQGGNTAKAVQKLEEFSRSMNERIDNILMVSRAGSDQSEEVFDAARVLAGLNQVYLTEPAFLQRAKVELEAREPTPVVAVRWDFLLMVENILKNALEALTIKGGYGNIRVTLAGRVLTIANDGGAMALCHDCRNDCLKCTQYGRPGQTNKPGGSGHGLAQVFTTCRQYGWTCRIRTHEDWTIFEIGLAKPGA